MSDLESEQESELRRIFTVIKSFPEHNNVVDPDLFTPYDAYMDFMSKIKALFGEEKLNRLAERMSPGSSYEDVFTPAFVMSLAIGMLKETLK